MILRLATISIALLLIAGPASAAKNGVPSFDIRPTCRASAAADPQHPGDISVCLESERKAQQELQGNWSRYTRAAKALCVPLTQTGVDPAYSELVTCLEMATQSNELNGPSAVR